ncbi:MAG: taurine ABC transporter permease TauC [Candidatus Velthaea sp.]
MTASRPLRFAGPARALVGLALLVILWSSAVWFFRLSPVILPSPAVVAVTVADLVRSGAFWRDFATSFGEFAAGYIVAVFSGVGTGTWLALSPVARRYIEPLLVSARFIVPFSLVPLAVLWFGTSMSGKVFIVWYATFFVIVLNTTNAIESIDPLLLRVADMLRIRGLRRFRVVLIPASLRRILTGLRIGVAHAWIAVIAAEYIGSVRGLGHMITNAQSGLETNVILAGMVVIGIVGSVMSLLLASLIRVASPRGAA